MTSNETENFRAVNSNQTKTVELLLEWGALVNLEASEGKLNYLQIQQISIAVKEKNSICVEFANEYLKENSNNRFYANCCLISI